MHIVGQLLGFERSHADHLFGLIDLGSTKDLSLLQFTDFFKHWDR